MRKTVIYNILCTLIVFVSVAGLAMALLRFNEVSTTPVSSRALVTAAHLGDIAGYEQVYVDEETDFAIYVKEGYIADGLSQGDIVSLTGTTGTVDSVSDKEFSVVVNDISKIVPGVSGEPVYIDNTPVGFISGWSSGSLRCIFY